MSRILFSPESFNMGETTRGIEIARAAAQHGHEVLFHVYSPRHLKLIEDAQLPVCLSAAELPLNLWPFVPLMRMLW